MQLSTDKIREITTGAVLVTEENGFVSFKRFTSEQEAWYKQTNEAFYLRGSANAGIKLLFRTDSKNLFLNINVVTPFTRKYFSVDVFINGKPIGYIDNFSDIDLPQGYAGIELDAGEYEKSFELGEGEKTVCIHLPWTAMVQIKQMCIDDKAFAEAIKPEKKLLVYGDSITQGFDALRPSNRYIAKIADKLGAEEYNKAIGGEGFCPKLAAMKDSFVPDYITVAYGTNDWYVKDEETFKTECRAFFENVSNNYPGVKTFVITPIWRKNFVEQTKFGAFENIEKHIKNATNDMENVTVISGFDLVPKEEKYFGDLSLHPNDSGFEHYAENLYEKIKEKI